MVRSLPRNRLHRPNAIIPRAALQAPPSCAFRQILRRGCGGAKPPDRTLSRPSRESPRQKDFALHALILIPARSTARSPNAAAARSTRSSTSRNRLRSALENILPPPCRNGSAERKSCIRSRVASAMPTLAAVSSSPLCLTTRAPAATHFAAKRDVPGHHHIPRPASLGDPLVRLIRPAGDETHSRPRGFCEGRMPPFDTTTIRTLCRVATVSASAFTGQASASM